MCLPRPSVSSGRGQSRSARRDYLHAKRLSPDAWHLSYTNWTFTALPRAWASLTSVRSDRLPFRGLSSREIVCWEVWSRLAKSR